jgi:hypothetical protein
VTGAPWRDPSGTAMKPNAPSAASGRSGGRPLAVTAGGSDATLSSRAHSGETAYAYPSVLVPSGGWDVGVGLDLSAAASAATTPSHEARHAPPVRSSAFKVHLLLPLSHIPHTGC